MKKKYFEKYLLIPLSHKAVHKSCAFQVNYSKNLVHSNSKKNALHLKRGRDRDTERKRERACGRKCTTGDGGKQRRKPGNEFTK